MTGETTLVTTAAVDVNVYRSSRNIQGVTVSPVADLNALAVLTPKRLLVTKAALDEIRARAARRRRARRLTSDCRSRRGEASVRRVIGSRGYG